MHLCGTSIRRFAPRAILLTTLVAGVLFLFIQPADAITIAAIKGSNVMINTEDADVSVGQRYYAITDGKKRALIVISKVKGSKAIGKIVKGAAQNGAELRLAIPVSAKGRRRGNDGRSAGPGIFVGGALGLGMDSQTVTQSGASSSTAMTGMGYSLKGFADIPISGGLGVIGRAGVDTLNLSGGGFSTSVMFATADALMRYSFSDGTWRPYAAGGAGLYYPVSQSSGVLQGVTSTIVFFLDLGLNIFMSPNSYITMAGELGYYPPSSSVSTDTIDVFAGLGFRY